jgi:neutral trehalase
MEDLFRTLKDYLASSPSGRRAFAFFARYKNNMRETFVDTVASATGLKKREIREVFKALQEMRSSSWQTLPRSRS